jgi:hypothetical protein
MSEWNIIYMLVESLSVDVQSVVLFSVCFHQQFVAFYFLGQQFTVGPFGYLLPVVLGPMGTEQSVFHLAPRPSQNGWEQRPRWWLRYKDFSALFRHTFRDSSLVIMYYPSHCVIFSTYHSSTHVN